MPISSTGIGSGLKVEDIITQLIAVEKQPLTTLQAKAAVIQTKISDYSQIKSLVSTLSDAASKITLDSGWSSLTTTSSNTGAVNVAVTGLASATSFSMGVSQLARGQSTASSAVTASTALNVAGTLTLQAGTWAGNSFTPGAATGVPITIAATDTMAQIASKINDAGAGIVATVLTDGTGDRLMLRSTSTGDAAGFRVLASGDSDGNDTDSNGLSKLGFDLAATTAYGMGANTYQAAQNAKATINGIAVTSATNQFKDAIAGMTITASAVTTTNVEVTASVEKTTLTTNIQAFVDAYNAINKYLTDATAYDTDSKKAGDLQGDSTARTMRGALRSLLSSNAPGGAFTTLSQIGIKSAIDGTLSVDATKLGAALDKPDDVKKLFAQTGNVAANNGIARKVKLFTTDLLSFSGTLNNKNDALNAETKSNASDVDKVNTRAAAVEKRLRATYTALDTKMATLTSLSTYITQQVDAWNSQK